MIKLLQLQKYQNSSINFTLATVSKKDTLFFKLAAVKDLGRAQLLVLLKELGLPLHTKALDLTVFQASAASEQFYQSRLSLINQDFKKVVSQNIKNLIDIKHYRGLRFAYGLPTKGQRTRTNRRTAAKLHAVWKQQAKKKTKHKRK